MHLTRHFHGSRPDNPHALGIVIVDSPTSLRPTIGVPFHHPTAPLVTKFMWGEHASEAELVLLADAILHDVLNYNEIAPATLGVTQATVEDFADLVVAPMPNVWSLSDGEVLEWLQAWKEART